MSKSFKTLDYRFWKTKLIGKIFKAGFHHHYRASLMLSTTIPRVWLIAASSQCYNYAKRETTKPLNGEINNWSVYNDYWKLTFPYGTINCHTLITCWFLRCRAAPEFQELLSLYHLIIAPSPIQLSYMHNFIYSMYSHRQKWLVNQIDSSNK